MIWWQIEPYVYAAFGIIAIIALIAIIIDDYKHTDWDCHCGEKHKELEESEEVNNS